MKSNPPSNKLVKDTNKLADWTPRPTISFSDDIIPSNIFIPRLHKSGATPKFVFHAYGGMTKVSFMTPIDNLDEFVKPQKRPKSEDNLPNNWWEKEDWWEDDEKDIEGWMDKELAKNSFLKPLREMTYFEFLEFYKNNFVNDYTEHFETLDLSNSIGVTTPSSKTSERYPNTQVKSLLKFIELSKQATRKEEIPFIIYLLVNKDPRARGLNNPTDLLVRTGITRNLPEDRIVNYKKSAHLGTTGTLYDHLRLQGDKNFKMIILDIQTGKDAALNSEELFTIYFNRRLGTDFGYDLKVNLEYNQIVGDLSKKYGVEHPGFKKHIFYKGLKELIEKGYDKIDIATMYGVTQKIINKRIKLWWGADMNFDKVASILRIEKLKEYYSQGLTVKEIAKKFIKFDIDNKLKVLGTIEKAREVYLKGIEKKHYSIRVIYEWTKKHLKLSPGHAYEKYYVKPILTTLLHIGLEKYKAIEVLKAMGVQNPHKKGCFYDADSLTKLLNDRLWGKTWSEMRDIFLEPLIEEVLRKVPSLDKIGELISFISTHVRENFISRYVKRKWRFQDVQQAQDFFKMNYLGRHEYDYYVHWDML